MDYRAGVIAATVVNLFIGKEAEPAAPFDFFPWNKDEEKEKQKKVKKLEQKAKVQRDKMRAFVAQSRAINKRGKK